MSSDLDLALATMPRRAEPCAMADAILGAAPAQVVSWDLETGRWRPGALAPAPVCLSASQRLMAPGTATVHDGRLLQSNGLDSVLIAVADKHDGGADTLRGVLGEIFSPFGPDSVGCNLAGFDCVVIAAHQPDMVPSIFRAFEEGRIHDVQIREKLLLLTTTGNLEYAVLPGGKPGPKLTFSLVELEQKYLGRNRSTEKDEDAWRYHYELLKDRPSDQWPKEARQYAIDDAEGALLVYEAQEESRHAIIRERGFDPFVTESFRCGLAFALGLVKCWGILIDQDKKREIEKQLEAELDPTLMPLLVSAGILRPAQPPRPHAKGHKNPDGTVKMTKGVEESIDTKLLQRLVEQVCVEHGLAVKRTDPSEKFPICEENPQGGQISTAKDVMQEIAHLHEALGEYQHRQFLQKLVTTELPRMGSIGIVYPNYDVLKETGRTSSFAGDTDKTGIPSANIQNVSAVKKLKGKDGKERGQINSRHCFIPRPGWVMYSVDYASLEFVSMAQTCFDLFGHSVMRDLINAGHDPHAYLGAQICYVREADFQKLCAARGDTSAKGIFETFKSMKGSNIYTLAELFKKYRKVAKPVGFGFPGGLGAKKFVQFARPFPYEVKVTVEEAQQLKEIWFQTYPEMQDYFRWINEQCVDPWNSVGGDLLYTYTTQFGMVRAGATYCAACNGRLLQSPATGEGAPLALWEVVRACYDPTLCSCLYGTRVLAYVHDEILGEIPEDAYMHERAHEVARIMCVVMQGYMKDVLVRAEPALMRRWDKDAEPVYDENKRLQIWTPKEKAA